MEKGVQGEQQQQCGDVCPLINSATRWQQTCSYWLRDERLFTVVAMATITELKCGKCSLLFVILKLNNKRVRIGPCAEHLCLLANSTA